MYKTFLFPSQVKDTKMSKTINLSPEELGSVKVSLSRTLNAILPDILNSTGMTSIPRMEVIEVCLDCNHLEIYGLVSNSGKNAIKKFRKLPYDKQIELAKSVFTYKTYGM